MPYKKVYHTLTCPECGKEYQVLTPAYIRKMGGKSSMLCASCLGRKQLAKNCPPEVREENKAKAKERYDALSDEKKEELKAARTAGTKKMWANMSDEERKAKSEKRSADRLNYLNSIDEQTRIENNRKLSEGKKAAFASMSDAERKQWKERFAKMLKNRWANLSDEEKAARTEKLKLANQQWHDSLSEEERKIILGQRTSKRNRTYWDNLTDEQRAEITKIQHIVQQRAWEEKPEAYKAEKIEMLKRISDEYWSHPENREKQTERSRKVWENMSDEMKKYIADRSREAITAIWLNHTEEERKAAIQRLTKMSRDHWDNLTEEERLETIRKMLAPSAGRNKFHQRFERQFQDSMLSERFRFEPEIPMSYNNIRHCWDYGIYSKETGDLVMLVDLDGVYFHADKYDYDGIHSKEERDEARTMSIPTEAKIKVNIIMELKFKECFEYMIKSLMVDYDDYVANLFKEMRSMPFPEPFYPEDILLASYYRLASMDTDNDVSLNSRIGDHLIQHFHQSIWRAHTRGNMSPYEAWYDDGLLMKCIKNRIVYQNHLNPNKILQGFNIAKLAPKVSVFSAARARILISQYLSKYDTIFDPFSGFSGRMLGAISLGKYYIGRDISSIHIMESMMIIDFLWKYGVNTMVDIDQADCTSYTGEYDCLFTCPPYSDKEQWEDVTPDTRTCDDWIDICLNNFKCHRYVFVVDYTRRYNEYVIDGISNKSHFSNNSEKIIIIDK